MNCGHGIPEGNRCYECIIAGLQSRVAGLEAGIKDALHFLDDQGEGGPTETALYNDLKKLLNH